MDGGRGNHQLCKKFLRILPMEQIVGVMNSLAFHILLSEICLMTENDCIIYCYIILYTVTLYYILLHYITYCYIILHTVTLSYFQHINTIQTENTWLFYTDFGSMLMYSCTL